MVAGGLFNAFVFSGAGYLFKMINSDGYVPNTVCILIYLTNEIFLCFYEIAYYICLHKYTYRQILGMKID